MPKPEEFKEVIAQTVAETLEATFKELSKEINEKPTTEAEKPSTQSTPKGEPIIKDKSTTTRGGTTELSDNVKKVVERLRGR